MTEPIKWAELTEEQRNALVAEKVMGLERVACPSQGRDHNNGALVYNRDHGYWRCRRCNAHSASETDELFQHNSVFDPLLNYTTDLNAAWQLVEKVTQPPKRPTGLKSPNVIFMLWWHNTDLWAANRNDAAQAICLAALRACGVEVE